MKTTCTTLSGMTAILAFAATPGLAKDYSANTFLNDANPLAKAAYVDFVDRVSEATGGEVNFRLFTSESLLPAGSSLQGVSDGVAQVTYHAGTYTPSELPVNNLVSDIPFYNTDPMVMAFASTEFGMTNPEALAEWDRNGIVFGGGYSTTPYFLQCTSPVTTADDIGGKRMRMAGGAWSRFGDFAGAVPISIPSSEAYTGLDKGSLDCAALGAESLIGLSLKDVVSAVTTLPVGVYYAGFHWGYNRAFWQSLTDDQRQVLFDEMARGLIQTQIDQQAAAVEALDMAESEQVEILTPDASLEQVLTDFVAADEPNVVEIAKERGVADPEAILSDFKAVTDKWAERLQDVPSDDVETLVTIAREELYGQMDPSSYGMN